MDCFAEPVIGRRFAPTRWLAMTELIRSFRAGEDKGIRCNVIAPEFMDTPMGRDAGCRWGVTAPFGHRGTGRQFAYAALFLISNESSYVNAHTLFLDGNHLSGIMRG